MIEKRTDTNAQFKLKVGRGVNGLGLFAMEPIPKGKKIIEYVGNVLIDVPDEDQPNNLYIFNINKHLDIDGSPRWNTARYINHSCRANAESDTVKGHVWIKAKRNIMLGEERIYQTERMRVSALCEAPCAGKEKGGRRQKNREVIPVFSLQYGFLSANYFFTSISWTESVFVPPRTPKGIPATRT